MMHLDTHVVVWLYEGRVERLPSRLRSRLGQVRPLISPMVRLELACLFEAGRLTVGAPQILDALYAAVDLGVAESRFDRVAAIASTLTWTRDPFDRPIVAHALADDLPLVTADRRVLEHAANAIWAA